MYRLLGAAFLGASLVVANGSLARAVPATGGFALVTVAKDGTPANGASLDPVLSSSGRYVAFASAATNLIVGDTNGVWDVFVRDLERGVTERVSVDSAGTQANGNSDSPTISPDGRYVAFSSRASNIVAGDTNGVADIFVHDRRTGMTERVSVDDSGNEADGATTRPVLSEDGRFVAFDSFAHNLVPGRPLHVGEVLIRDRKRGQTERVALNDSGDQALGGSSVAGMSDDGRFVAFGSNAGNLVPDPASGDQVYVRDREAKHTERVSVNDGGVQANAASFTSTPFAMSRDGRYVTFYSPADNLVPHDTNGVSDIFLRDRRKGTTTRLSVDSKGFQADGLSQWPTISGDGRYVAYISAATNLVTGDHNLAADIFVRNVRTGVTKRRSVASSGLEANGASAVPTISGHRQVLVFLSYATNISNAAMGASGQIYALDLHSDGEKAESPD